MRKAFANWQFRAFIYAFVLISELFAGLRMYELIDKTSDAIQAWAVTVLAGITAFYAVQTKAQADASVQMAEAALHAIRQPHLDNLFELGKRLRDPTQIVPWPGDMAYAIGPGWPGHLEDAPMYPSLRCHLKDNKCWEQLDEFRLLLEAYRTRCLEMAATITEQARARVEEITPGLWNREYEWGTQFVKLVLQKAYAETSGERSDDIHYRIEESSATSRGGPSWPFVHLHINGLAINAESEHEASSLKRLHEDLCVKFINAENIQGLHALRQEVDKIRRRLKETLQPDDRLRKLIAEGHCDYCP